MYQNKLSQFANMLKDNKTMTAVIEAHIQIQKVVMLI